MSELSNSRLVEDELMGSLRRTRWQCLSRFHIHPPCEEAEFRSSAQTLDSESLGSNPDSASYSVRPRASYLISLSLNFSSAKWRQ